MPEHAKASLSSCKIQESDKPAAWCPHVADENTDPVNHFLHFLVIFDSFLFFSTHFLRLLNLDRISLLGLCAAAVWVTPRSLALLLMLNFMPYDANSECKSDASLGVEAVTTALGERDNFNLCTSSQNATVAGTIFPTLHLALYLLIAC